MVGPAEALGGRENESTGVGSGKKLAEEGGDSGTPGIISCARLNGGNQRKAWGTAEPEHVASFGFFAMPKNFRSEARRG